FLSGVDEWKHCERLDCFSLGDSETNRIEHGTKDILLALSRNSLGRFSTSRCAVGHSLQFEDEVARGLPSSIWVFCQADFNDAFDGRCGRKRRRIALQDRCDQTSLAHSIKGLLARDHFVDCGAK